MSLSTTRSDFREGYNRMIFKNKQSLKELFLEVQRGHQAEIEIMRVLLESCGVFDEAKENITQEDVNIGSLKDLQTADSINVGQGILDYVAERESMSITDIVANSTPTSSVPPFSHRNLMGGKKPFGRRDSTSVSSDQKLRPKAVRPKTVPLTSRRSRIQRQATPFRINNEKKLLKASRGLGKSRNRNPTNLRTGLIHGNSHIEEKKEHGEDASAVIIPDNNSIIRVSDPQSQRGEPSYSSLYSPSVIDKNPALFKRKEGHSSIGVLREEKALTTDDSDTDEVTDRRHSRAVKMGTQNRKKNSLSSNLGTLPNAKVEDVSRVPSYKSEHQHMKNLKPICSDNV